METAQALTSSRAQGLPNAPELDSTQAVPTIPTLIPFRPIAFHIPAPLPTSPGFIVQVTALTLPRGEAPGSLMLWVGVGDGPAYVAPMAGQGDSPEKNEYELALEESADERVEGYLGSANLGNDWACAMPSRPSTASTASATLLTTSTSNSRAELISRRLARTTNCQIFLSMDLPVENMINTGGSNGAGGGFIGAVGAGEGAVGRIVLGLEKGLGGFLREVLRLGRSGN